MHYYDSEGTLNIHHARLRMYCSNLNDHEYAKTYWIAHIANAGRLEKHITFSKCVQFIMKTRAILLDNLSSFEPITVQFLLFGVRDESYELYEENYLVFKHVKSFIRDGHIL